MFLHECYWKKMNYNMTVKIIFMSIYYHTMCSVYVIVTVSDPILIYICCHMIRVCVYYWKNKLQHHSDICKDYTSTVSIYYHTM